ncbi:MmgE/PrpD family protein [uncultured Erythrobacter sp.]|uniref:MmgE/PrpD family protein n=1 Tax=uncultured Erythrobacter sp. TaxID=263913 RepID=UPI00260AB47B|nr:MmgE/PrpD family protein [uncultured Erythrobacter sp.]
MSATDDLLAFAGADHKLPPKVRTSTIRLLRDTLAIGAAAVDAPGEPAILQTARAFGQGEEARLLGTDERLPAPSAAFVNGYRIHCLEWDAVHEPAVVHAMSVVTAALGAVIDRRGGNNREETLVALAIGVDIASGLGLCADSAMRFFRPAICGVMGAAVAVARIDGAPLDDALGLAYSSAAGTMQAHVEGSETLPFQIANAARAAVVASDLAKAGFSAPKDPLDGPFGYLKLFEDGDLTRYTQDLGKVWRIAQVSTKPYPSGRASHAALSKLARLRLNPDNVASIELACPPLIRRLVDRPYSADMSPAWARLCMPYLAALMLTDKRIDPRRFSPEDIADPALAAIAGKVRLTDDGNADENALFPQSLTITMADGAVERHLVEHTLGSPGNPLNRPQTMRKLRLARELAPDSADPRIFEDTHSYFTDPK